VRRTAKGKIAKKLIIPKRNVLRSDAPELQVSTEAQVQQLRTGSRRISKVKGDHIGQERRAAPLCAWAVMLEQLGSKEFLHKIMHMSNQRSARNFM
jgi:hypothetical protein